MAAKKSMKDAAAAGTSVFDQIARGNTTDAQDITGVNYANNAKKVHYTKNVYNAQNARGGRPMKYGGEMVRLNLKVPADIKEYLTIAAAKESIAQRRSISLTEYLCDLVAADQAQHKDE